mmetsp:Transcript_9917/g.20189  ORF Transcript_9917/g.20189 Transcript_9917/m.20189 type:complete len:200 (+) Transcript_9917:493-1092(+)
MSSLTFFFSISNLFSFALLSPSAGAAVDAAAPTPLFFKSSKASVSFMMLVVKSPIVFLSPSFSFRTSLTIFPCSLKISSICFWTFSPSTFIFARPWLIVLLICPNISFIPASTLGTTIFSMTSTIPSFTCSLSPATVLSRVFSPSSFTLLVTAFPTFCISDFSDIWSALVTCSTIPFMASPSMTAFAVTTSPPSPPSAC